MSTTVDETFWRNSPSPVAEEDGDGGQEWGYEVVGEEVDNGVVKYEIDWDNWTRADGTTQTWDDIHPSHMVNWRRKQKRQRATLLRDCIDIELDPFSGTDIHNTETRLRAQAFEEKLEARQKYSPKLEEQMDSLLAEKLGPGWDLQSEPSSPSSPRTSASLARLRLSTMRQQQTRPHVKPKGPPNTPADQPIASTSSSVTLPHSPPPRSVPRPPSARQPTSSPDDRPRKRRLEDVDSGPSREEVLRCASHQGGNGKSPINSLRLQISRQWTKIAQSNGAAPISFVNDVDEEEIPANISSFQYLEKGYIYAEGITKPNAAFQIGCDCKRCLSASKCDCQSISDVVNKYGHRGYAYNKYGLFSFNVPRGIEVIECNEVCRCGPGCNNRISQRPRDVALEIFKTAGMGWGVRASIDIKRGKVLGMYTGRLITRQAALEMDTNQGGFCFDLDGQEDLEGAEGDELAVNGKFSVDSRACGNWTRFVNHSCAPNMTIYLVVYDTIPNTNCPYIAFVAREFIQAGTELTMDYDPVSANRRRLVEPPAGDSEGMRKCFCGTEKCRDYVRMY